MNINEVPLLTAHDAEHWEPTLFKGALEYFGIPSRVVDYSLCPEFAGTAFRVVVPSRAERSLKSDLPEYDGITVLAGRAVTLGYVRKALYPEENEVLIYGEPYALIPQLVRDPVLLKQSRGKAILGPLLDPDHYSTPSGARPSGIVPLMTSIGCEKRCGYCSYGATYSCLYPDCFSRRSRNWRSLEKEMTLFIAKGVDSFRFIADQCFSVEPEKNRELDALACNWNSKNGRPSCAFTVSPAEVLNNRQTFENMARSFRLFPQLSIDSFDDVTLSALHLNFTASNALEAARFLASLKLPLRLNYLFVTPWKTIHSLQTEFSFLLPLAKELSYLSPCQQALIAQDLFSGRVGLPPGAPISSEGIAEAYEARIPTELLELMANVQDAMYQETEGMDLHSGNNLLLRIVEAGLKCL